MRPTLKPQQVDAEADCVTRGGHLATIKSQVLQTPPPSTFTVNPNPFPQNPEP